MCYEPLAFSLSAAIVAFGVIGNLDFAWTYKEAHGGLWFHCPSKNYPDFDAFKGLEDKIDASIYNECHKYTKSVSEIYGQSWDDLMATKVVLLLGTSLGVPILILITLQVCKIVRFWIAALIGVFQFLCLVSAAALMTHSFIYASPENLNVGYSTVCVWLAAIMSVILVFVVLSSEKKCWESCWSVLKRRNKTGDRKDLEKVQFNYEATATTQIENSEKSSLVESPRNTTITSGLASQEASLDEMPEVAPNNDSGRTSESSGSEVTKSLVDSQTSMSPRSSAGSSDRSRRLSGRRQSATRKNVSGRDSINLPSTIEEENELLVENETIKEMSTDVDFDTTDPSAAKLNTEN